MCEDQAYVDSFVLSPAGCAPTSALLLLPPPAPTSEGAENGRGTRLAYKGAASICKTGLQVDKWGVDVDSYIPASHHGRSVIYTRGGPRGAASDSHAEANMEGRYVEPLVLLFPRARLAGWAGASAVVSQRRRPGRRPGTVSAVEAGDGGCLTLAVLLGGDPFAASIGATLRGNHPRLIGGGESR